MTDEIDVEERLPLSTLLLTWDSGPSAPVSVAAIVDHFGPRSFGAALFILAIPNLFPLPPGSSTLLGLPLLIIAPQLALGARRPLLPSALAKRTMDRDTLVGFCRRVAPWVERAERLTTRRFGFLFGHFGDAAIGAVCTLLAVVLILPIPLGNMLPAAAVATLALSLVQRDGLLAVVGYGLAVTSGCVLVISGHLVVAAVARLGSMTGLW